MGTTNLNSPLRWGRLDPIIEAVPQSCPPLDSQYHTALVRGHGDPSSRRTVRSSLRGVFQAQFVVTVAPHTHYSNLLGEQRQYPFEPSAEMHIKQCMSQPSAKKAGPKYGGAGVAALRQTVRGRAGRGGADRRGGGRGESNWTPGREHQQSREAEGLDFLCGEWRGRELTRKRQHQDVRDHCAVGRWGARPDHRHRRDVLGGKEQRSSRKCRRPSRRRPSRRRSSRSRRTRSSRRAIRSRRTCRPTRRAPDPRWWRTRPRRCSRTACSSARRTGGARARWSSGGRGPAEAFGTRSKSARRTRRRPR